MTDHADRLPAVPTRVRVARVLVIIALSVAALGILVALVTMLSADAWPRDLRRVPGTIGAVLPTIAVVTMIVSLVGAVLVLPRPRNLRMLLPVGITVALAVATIWIVAAFPAFASPDCAC